MPLLVPLSPSFEGGGNCYIRLGVGSAELSNFHESMSDLRGRTCSLFPRAVAHVGLLQLWEHWRGPGQRLLGICIGNTAPAPTLAPPG